MQSELAGQTLHDITFPWTPKQSRTVLVKAGAVGSRVLASCTATTANGWVMHLNTPDTDFTNHTQATVIMKGWEWTLENRGYAHDPDGADSFMWAYLCPNTLKRFACQSHRQFKVTWSDGYVDKSTSRGPRFTALTRQLTTCMQANHYTQIKQVIVPCLTLW